MVCNAFATEPLPALPTPLRSTIRALFKTHLFRAGHCIGSSRYHIIGSRSFKEIGAMTSKPIKIPGADHPITIARNPARVVVTLGGRVVADTRAALTLSEASYP